MFTTLNTEKFCCTCGHWRGVRVFEEDGCVYSLKNIDGICRAAPRTSDADTPHPLLTLPSNTCHQWEGVKDLPQAAYSPPILR